MKNVVVWGAMIFTTLLATAFTTQFLSSWNIADDYVIKFDGSGATGTFSGLSGEIYFNANNLEASKINVSVQANTIDTGNKSKNKLARGDSWLDVENSLGVSL